VAQFRKELKATGIPKILDTELYIRGPSPEPRLDGTGMVIVNPPWTLEAELKLILPELAKVMQQDKAGFSRVEWLAGE
jgi:23S rRNA (adenine2030-N6)-methyltransferase